MKRTTIITAMAAATLLSSMSLFAGPEGGNGGEHARRGHGGPGHPSKEEILKRFDADGDGQLNEEERAAAHAAREAHEAGKGPGKCRGGKCKKGGDSSEPAAL